MKTLLKIALVCALVFLAPSLYANVVRPAPDFTWRNAAGATTTLAKVRGQSVILLIAPNVENRRLLSQFRAIQEVYQFLAAARVVAFVAFSQNPGSIPSNIPFVVALNGPRVASAYGVPNQPVLKNGSVPNGFGIAVIGRDGNLDYFSNKVLPGQRILDIINNSFAVQQALRK